MPAGIPELVAAARDAQAVAADWPQERVDAVVAAVGWALYREDHARACAELACAETRMGTVEDKMLKHRRKTLGTLRDLQGVKTVGAIERDEARGLIKIAKPVGVVAAITPVTNPTATPAANGLALLKTRNALVVGAHLKAREATGLAVRYMRDALAQVGAPVDLVQALPEPTKDRIRDLMAAVDLVVATGSNALVKAAYSSGTPAYGVGDGNAVVVIDATADPAAAVRMIVASKTFDHATSCSSENSLVIQAEVYARVLDQLRRCGGYLCSAAEREKLRAVMWRHGATPAADIVGRPATAIARQAGLEVPADTRVLLVEGCPPLEDDPFAGEKLSPVLALWRVDTFAEAVAMVERIIRRCGYGHSCGIHSTDEDHVLALAMRAHVGRVMVNQPQCHGNSGNVDNGMPFSMTLGCGTWGGNISSENIVWKHFLNTTWVSRPIRPVVPDEEAIFGEHWRRYGR